MCFQMIINWKPAKIPIKYIGMNATSPLKNWKIEQKGQIIFTMFHLL